MHEICRNLALTLIEVLRPRGAAGCAWFVCFNFFLVEPSGLPRKPKKVGLGQKIFFL